MFVFIEHHCFIVPHTMIGLTVKETIETFGLAVGGVFRVHQYKTWGPD